MIAEAGDASILVEEATGGRLASLRVDGHELLAPDTGRILTWGCYAMVPWAGRIRRGRFAFEGVDHQLVCDLPTHAIHGLGYASAWRAESEQTLTLDLEGRWDFGGTAWQQYELEPDELVATVGVTAGDRPMPLVLGWHPCFRRDLGTGPIQLDFSPTWMWRRDAEGLPTEEQVPPPPGPWDDAFGGITRPPRLTWPGLLTLTIEADCPVWVVYDEETDIVCIEPMTGIPDAFNHEPDIIAPRESKTLTMTLRWSRP